MNLDQYIKDATRTESRIDVVNTDLHTMLKVMKAFVAAGSLLDIYKKHIFYGKPINEQHWKDQEEILRNQTKWTLFPPSVYGETDKVDIEVDPRIFHSTVGIATESTELIEALVKSIENNIAIDTVNLCEEMFDAMWYVFVGHDAMGRDLDNTLNMGFDKLKKRYPNKFTSDDAINRDIKAERKILEDSHL
jgi:hypothetical protein